MDIKQTRAEAFLHEAYTTQDQTNQQAFYTKWAADYDEQMAGLQYSSPRILSALLLQHLPDKEAHILDVGCGTGLTVKSLYESGYTHLHGIDLSPDMIAVAQSRGIYQDLKVADLNQALSYPDAHFDAVISSGTFTHGHVGPKPLDELIRIVKPAGILAFTVHQDLWQTAGFSAAITDFEQAGQLHCLHLELDHLFDNKPADGWFCVYQKLT